MTHNIDALFIDGPWDGRRITLGSHVLQHPSYVVTTVEPADFAPNDPHSPHPPSTQFRYSFMRATGSPDKSGAMYFAFPSDWLMLYTNPNDHIFATLFRGYVGSTGGNKTCNGKPYKPPFTKK